MGFMSFLVFYQGFKGFFRIIRELKMALALALAFGFFRPDGEPMLTANAI